MNLRTANTSGWRPVSAFFAAALCVSVATAAIDPAFARGRARSEATAAQSEAGRQAAAFRPVIAIISLGRQQVTLYSADGSSISSRISSGTSGRETPQGVFSVLQKEVDHHSNLYNDASMPYMQRITWSGVAMHAGSLPGYPASHGCVRLPYKFAQQIFGQTSVGMRVIITRGDAAPAGISHPALFQPKPVEHGADESRAISDTPPSGNNPAFVPQVTRWPERALLQSELKAAVPKLAAAAMAAAEAAKPAKRTHQEAAAHHAKVEKALRAVELAKKRLTDRLAQAERSITQAKSPKAAEQAGRAKASATLAVEKFEPQVAAATAEAQKSGAILEEAAAKLKEAVGVESSTLAEAKEARNKVLPVSVFVSLKSKHLYVRQGNEPVFDTPIAIANPEQSIGTHVYTAVEYTQDANNAVWRAVSLDSAWSATGGRGKGKQLPPPATADASQAKAALDRVTFPGEVAAKLSEYVWPGSSLIISDEGLSKETGKATDFVVVMNGEPHGALANHQTSPSRDEFGQPSSSRRYSTASTKSPGSSSIFSW